jgi:hypothetical protein
LGYVCALAAAAIDVIATAAADRSIQRRKGWKKDFVLLMNAAEF